MFATGGECMKRIVITMEVSDDTDIFGVHEQLLFYAEMDRAFVEFDQDSLAIYENVEAFLEDESGNPA